MRKLFCALTLLVSLASTAVAGTNTVRPTTTLAAETGNNTSGAATFTTQTNGNIGVTNVSKLPIRSLLYPGSTTKIYAHLVPWFGGSNHMNVGYASNNATQVANQAADMQSRGIDGLIIDWYGPNFSRENGTSLLWKFEAERRGMEFAIMEDGGALKACSKTVGCDVTQRMIDDLNYAYTNFVQSSAYMRMNGRPVFFFFGVEAYVVDWTRVRANVLGNPYFIQRNSGPFTDSRFDGAYGWLASEMATATDPMALLYLKDFYGRATTYPTKIPTGSTYPGFDDSLASWSGSKYINRQCGQTWIETMNYAGRYYSASKQLPAMQLVTWNDYEEGSEIETGIENCVTVSASVANGAVNWSITGNENTLDHFTVFISTDGQNLMALADAGAGARTMNIDQYGFAPGTYQVFVKAIAKASMTNKMSNAASYTVLNQVPVVSVTASAPSGPAPQAAVSATISATDTDGSIASSSIDFGNGTVVNGTSGSATYATAGTYTITATVTDNNGATSTSTTTVTIAVNQVPAMTLSATPTSGIGSVTVNASISASDVDGTIAGSRIDFGNGTIVNGTSGSTTYTGAGTYTITATATDNLGASVTKTQTITVTANQAPSVSLAVISVSGTAPFTVTATSTASDADGTIAGSRIDFGNGTVVNGTSGSATYTAAGTYTITATVTDNLGATSTASQTVTVNAIRRVNILMPSDGSTVTSPARFVASTESGTTVTTMQIYVDNVLVYNAPGASLDTRLTLMAGAHFVVIKAWDANGSFTKSMNITVKQNMSPTAVLAATPTTGAASLTVSASNAASSDSDGTIVSRTIDFGNGTVVNGTSASYTYTTPGTYTIRTTVTDDGGATSTASQTVTVSTPQPYVNIISPTNSAKVPTSLRVQAKGWAPSGVKAMQVYVDGKLVYQTGNATVDTTVNVAVGTREVVVKGWDMLGNSFMSSVTVNAYKSTNITTVF